MITKIINWLNGIWTSFQVARNTQRLVFLLHAIDNWMADHERDTIQDQIVTMATYKNVVTRFICDHPRLDSNIWPLDQAIELQGQSALLIAMGERLLYGTD